jgi:hypothetical protein
MTPLPRASDIKHIFERAIDQERLFASYASPDLNGIAAQLVPRKARLRPEGSTLKPRSLWLDDSSESVLVRCRQPEAQLPSSLGRQVYSGPAGRLSQTVARSCAAATALGKRGLPSDVLKPQFL